MDIGELDSTSEEDKIISVKMDNVNIQSKEEDEEVSYEMN